MSSKFPRLKFTLQQLRYFLVVGKIGSIADAAELLYVSSPSISVAIKQLESVFEVQLFSRHHGRGLRLTPAGKKLYEEIARCYCEMEELQATVLGLNKEVSGIFDIGCLTSLAPFAIPRAVKAISSRYDSVSLIFSETGQSELISRVRDGTLELALTFEMHLSEDIKFNPIRGFKPYAILPADSHLADMPSVDLKTLAKEPLILLDVPISRDYFYSLFRPYGLMPKVAYRMHTTELIRTMVADGYGYSLFCTPQESRVASDGREFVVRELSDDVAPLNMGVIHLENDNMTTSASELMNMLIEVLK